MNVRPTRVPSPPADTFVDPDRLADANRAMIEQRTGLPQRATVTAPTARAAPAYPPKLAKAILQVTRSINPVAKLGWNEFHKYNYRKFEDVFEELVPLINAAGIIIEQTELGRTGFEKDLLAITYVFTLISEDGEVWPSQPELTAICKIRDAKGIIDDKAASKCNTQAQKYFYTSFFKIRTVDTSEADHDSGSPQQKRRPVPSPSGKMPPHLIPIVDGESAADWGKRFNDFIDKAASEAEIDHWYEVNVRVFDKIKERYVEVYNALCDHMEAKVATFKKPDPISSGTAPAKDDTFPADRKPDNGIPAALQRKPTLGDLNENDRDWYIGLRDTFEACEGMEELVDQYQTLMGPFEDRVSPMAWKMAIDLHDANIQRLSV